jgi:1-acyl-sn-glycerol-3-phosphate acyltransferase
MFTKLRTALLLSIFAISIAIAIIFMYAFSASNRAIRRVWGTFTLWTLGAKVHVHGTHDPKAGLMVMNHRSMADIILMESIFPADPCWIAKAELANVPFYGHIIKGPKNISIEREDKRGLITMLKLCKERIAENRTLMIFPEGTRSQNDELLEFKEGGRIIAEKFDLVVQPIVVYGTDIVLDTKNLKAVKGDIHIHYLPSFTPEKKSDWFDTLRDDMQKEFLLLKEKAN